jgi:hypothetical protein
MVQFAPRVFSPSSGDDADAAEALGDEIATLAAHMVRGS